MTEAWRCESLRLSAIWADGRDASSLLSWESAVGSPPDHHESQPKLRLIRDHGLVAENALNLEMRSAPGRIDWLAMPALPPVPAPQISPFSNFPLLTDAVDVFTFMLFDKAAEAYDAVRFAFGMTTVRPTTSVRESYEDLARLLPDIKVPLEGASELFFQINRPRLSSVTANFKINRIARWMSIATGQALIGQASTAMLPLQLSGDPHYATRVELDISTPADSRELISKSDRLPLLREMLGMANESVERGDIP